jgi:signal transduction histidine kinase
VAQVAQTLLEQRLHAPALLRAALSESCQALGVGHGCIVLFDDSGMLRHAYVVGIQLVGEAASNFWHRLINQGILGLVQHWQRTIAIRNIATDPRWLHFPGSAKLPRKGSAIGVPLLFENRVLGVLLLMASEVGYFTEENTQTLEAIADLIAVALNNALLLEAARGKELAYRRTLDKIQSEQVESARLEQFRRDLAAMTYHDLRNPLQNIQLSLTALQRLLSSSDTDMTTAMIQLAQRSVEQISRMVKSLLDIERLEQGRALLNRQPTSLEPLLVGAVQLVQPMAEESEQTVCHEIAPKLPPIQVDSDMIQRVVMNLLENAIKHTPGGGSITLRARTIEDNVCISVSDTGPGIPRQFRDEIFDKFFRIKNSEAPNGVGLGLAFCRLAVEAHGGRIWVDSEAESGAVFTFTLPVTTPVKVARQEVIAG